MTDNGPENNIEIEKLQEENVQLNLDLEALRKKLKDCQSEMEQLKTTNIEQQDTIDNLIREMQETIFSPSDVAGDAKQEPKDTADREEHSDDQFDNLHKEMKSMEEMLTVAIDERDNAQTELELIKQELETLKSEKTHEADSKKEARQTSENEELQKLLEITLEEKDDLQSKLETAMSDIEKLNKSLEEAQIAEEKRQESLTTDHQYSTNEQEGEQTTFEEKSDTDLSELSDDEKISEIRNLKNQIESLKLTIKSLAAKRADADVDLTPRDFVTTSSGKKSPDEIDELRNELVSKEEAIAQLQNDYSELKNIINEKEQACQSLELKNSDLSETLLTLQHDCEEQTKTIAELDKKEKATSLKDEEIGKLQDQIVELQKELEAKQSLLDEQASLKKDFSNKVELMNLKIVELEKDKRDFEKHSIEMSDKIQNLEQKNKALEKMLEQEKKSAPQQKDQLLVRMKELTGELEALHNHNTDLKTKHKDLASQLETVTDRLQQREEKIVLLEATIKSDDTESKVTQLQSKIDELEDTISNIKDRAREMKSFYEDKLTKMNVMDTPVVELTGGITVNLNDLKQENAQLRQKIFSLENELKESHDISTQLKNQLASDSQRASGDQSSSLPQGLALQELDDQINELKEKLTQTTKQLTDKEEQVKQLNYQKINRDRGLSTLTTKLDTIQRTIDEIAKRKTKDLIVKEFSELIRFIHTI